MGACLLEKTALGDDEDSGKVKEKTPLLLLFFLFHVIFSYIKLHRGLNIVTLSFLSPKSNLKNFLVFLSLDFLL